MLRTARLLPHYRAFDAGLRPRPFPHRAASLLPGLLAATRTGLHTGKRRRAYEHDRSTTYMVNLQSAGRTPDRVQPGTFAGNQLRRLRLADVRQRPQGGFQVPGGPPRGERVRFVETDPDPGLSPSEGAFSASARVFRIARAV